MKTTFPAVLALVLGLAVPSQAAWRDISPADFTVKPIPKVGTAEYRAFNAPELDALLALQASRSAEDCSEAAAESVPDFQSLFGASGILSSAEMSAVGSFVDEGSRFVSKVSGSFKKAYARPRPYDEDSRIQPCAERPKGATSYPSTHSAAGVFDACVLGKLFPDRAAALAQQGRRVGDLRKIAGVHHPSDVEAGQALGQAVCDRLLSEPDFKAELDRARGLLP